MTLSKAEEFSIALAPEHYGLAQIPVIRGTPVSEVGSAPGGGRKWPAKP